MTLFACFLGKEVRNGPTHNSLDEFIVANEACLERANDGGPGYCLNQTHNLHFRQASARLKDRYAEARGHQS